MKTLYDYLRQLGVRCSYCPIKCYCDVFWVRRRMLGELRENTRQNMIDIAYEMILRGEY